MENKNGNDKITPASLESSLFSSLARFVNGVIFGLFVMFAIQAVFVFRAGEPPDGEGFVGGLLGLIISPIGMLLAWFLYPNRYIRPIILICNALVAILVLLILTQWTP